MPKNLRRRREPGYWRFIALLFPLLVLGVAGFMQVSVSATARTLAEERDLRELKLSTLRPALEEQERLQARQRQLGELIAVRNSVQAGKIDWTDELASMLETLPPPMDTGLPRVEFNALSMSALGGEPNDAYDGAPTSCGDDRRGHRGHVRGFGPVRAVARTLALLRRRLSKRVERRGERVLQL